MGLALIEDGLFGLRCSAAVIGLLALALTYLAIRAFWGDGWAFWASLLLACNHWHLYLSHSGVHYVQAELFYAGALLLLIYSMRWQSQGLHLFAGIWLGLGLMSYQANHLLPFLWLASRATWGLCQREPLSVMMKRLAFMLAALGLTLAPLLVHEWMLSGEVEFLTARAESVAAWQAQNWVHELESQQLSDAPLGFWLEQVERALLAPVFYRDRSGQYGAPFAMLDPVSGALWGIGLAVCVWRIRKAQYGLPLFWLAAVLILGGALSIDTPFYPRLAGAPPLLFMIVAVGLKAVFERAFRVSRVLAWTLIISLTAFSGYQNTVRFYHIYGRQLAPDTVHYQQTQLADLTLRHANVTWYVLAGGPGLLNSGTVRFLHPTVKGRDLQSPQQLPGRFEQPSVLLVPAGRKDWLAWALRNFPDRRVEMRYDDRGRFAFYLYWLQEKEMRAGG